MSVVIAHAVYNKKSAYKTVFYWNIIQHLQIESAVFTIWLLKRLWAPAHAFLSSLCCNERPHGQNLKRSSYLNRIIPVCGTNFLPMLGRGDGYACMLLHLISNEWNYFSSSDSTMFFKQLDKMRVHTFLLVFLGAGCGAWLSPNWTKSSFF